MGAKCCICIKDKKQPQNKDQKDAPIIEKAPILDPNDINPSLKSRPPYNPQSSIQAETFKAEFCKAISEENLEEITDIIKKGFPIAEPINHEKFTALHLACKLGKLAVVSHLIEKIDGSDINVQDENEKWTPLMIACINGHFEIVRYLMANKANKELVSEYQKKAVDYAKEGKFEDIVKALESK